MLKKLDADLPAPVRLYDQPMAPNPQRLSMFLAEKGVDYPREIVDLMAKAHRSDAHVAKTGAAQVPALELSDGTVLAETPTICRYVEALHPEPNLMGRDALEVAEIDMWHRRVELGLMAAVLGAFSHTNPHMAALQEQCAEWGAMCEDRIDGQLRMLDARLEGRDWIAADRLTIADITAFVAIRFQNVIKHAIPAGLDNLAAWQARMEARPSAS